MMILLLSVVGYVTFLAVVLYSVGFTGGLLVPKGINDGLVVSSTTAVLVNLALLSLFAVQHSVMARPAFKRWWTKVVPPLAERPIFVLLTNSILALIFWQWRPLPEVVWDLSGTFWANVLWGVFFAGWGIVVLSTFLIDHFELFGLKHGIYAARGLEMPRARFQERSLYRLVRHPIMLGFVLAFWAAPVMTQGHLLFAGVTTAYILVALQLEERDLAAAHGDAYRQYQKRVAMLLPIPRRQARS